MEGGKRIELSLGQEPGEFRLNLDGMAITIQMHPAAKGQAAPEGAGKSPGAARSPAPEVSPVLSQAEAQDIERLLNELNHYRHVSQEIYEGLGKLAKDINLSIQDLSLAELIQTSMGSPGEHLDQARNQVTDVLLMTEQATLNIMDLVEEIREDCQTVQTSLLNLTEASQGQEAEPASEDALGEDEDQSLWDQVFAQAEAFEQLLHPAEAEGGSAEAGAPSFSLAEVLQIILEFCTNEKVKQHLKAVQSKQDAIFQGPEAERALSLLAAGAPQADGFYQLPLEPVLELLKSHCDDERVKELFTKMANSADKLFPVTALPLEAKELDEAFPEDAPEFQGNPELESGWQELRQTLELLSERRQAAAGAGALRAPGSQETLDVQTVLDTVNRITKNLSRIIEALSFQDLSGQRLLKILKIIRQLQVQVLTLLVAAGDRLPTKLDDQAPAPPQSDQAREELDRLLTSVVPGVNQSTVAAPEEQPLDQNAINEILTSMGF
jgi:chemotaxis regulatin CheY-phosphate phosphatase CheZ